MFFTILLCGPSWSQQSEKHGRLSFVTIGKEQGIHNLKVTAVFQDSYGFVWLGTQGGVYRFDGYSSVMFENNPGDYTSLPSNFIAYRGFYEGTNGDLWIATNDAGIARFDRETEQFHTLRKQDARRPGLTFEGIAALYSDNKSGFWIATMGRGLNHYFPDRDSFFNYILPDNRHDTLMGSNLILSLQHDREGRLWIGTGNGAAILQPDGTFQRFFPKLAHSHSLSADFVYDIFQDSKGRIWLATKNGLNRWVYPNTFEQYYPETDPDVPQGGNYNLIYRIFEDSDGDFWLGTKAGLLRFYPERNDFEPVLHDPLDPASMLDGEVHGIFQDKMGNLWFATNEGVSILNKRATFFREEKYLLDQAIILSGAQKDGIIDLTEAGGRFWFSTGEGLFTCRRGESMQIFLAGAFTKLFVDSRGMLFAGTVQEHFYLIDPRQPRVIGKYAKQLRNTYSNTQAVGIQNSCFAEDTFGKIWLGTKSTLNRHDLVTGIWRQFYANPKASAALSNSVINDLYVDREGNLWIATNAGVNLLTTTELQKPMEDTTLRFICYRHKPDDVNSIGNDRVRTIFEDSRGGLWFGTDVGLHRLDPHGRWRRFFRENGLPDNKISGILEDENGDIWVSTASNGLSKFDINTGHFFNFSIRDGLHTDQFYSGACLKMNDGKLFFAGIKGANCFAPDKISFSQNSYPLYFTEFQLFNKPVDVGGRNDLLQQPLYMTREIALHYDQNVISFQFTALNFINPEKQVYRYRLVPFHRDWQYNGNNREATFTNLDPGVYQLRVETSENGYDWTGKSLTLRIRPPWYRTWWAYLLYAVTIGGILLGIRRFELRRQLAKAETHRLQELDQVKTRLYTNITHEFRTPLTVILGEASQLENQVGEKQKGGLAAIRRQGRHLLHLVNQMLDLAKVEAGSLRLNMVQGNVVLFLKYLLESFHSLADSRQIELGFEADTDEFWMDYDPDKLQTIMSNLLSNAIKFTPNGGRVVLNLSTFEKFTNFNTPQICIRISDTGQGISPEKIPFIFDRFYQADDSATRQAEGTGIGLTLTKELVHLLGGQINVDSRPGEGATFNVTLPVTHAAAKQQFQPDNFFTENQEMKPEPEDAAARNTPFQISNFKRNRPRLLLIEDNPDVLRYISSLLAADYQIYKAVNGKEGVEAAFRLVPDIVISDVMMPEMDGFEVCRVLKTDERTSHIPFILLTAKADQQSKIEGLTHGADVYLPKPFDREELLVRLEKLIELRRRLQERFSSSARFVNPEKAGIDKSEPPDIEERFMQKVVRIVEAQMSDEEFDMPQLCKALHMSRSNLFRKLKALTGKSATDFIRSLRLEKARALLETTDLNVTEVCYAVGFSSPNYFSRAFQEAFGVAPSEMRRR